MSMLLDKENNRIKVLIPNSEATISAQIKNIKDSEVTGFYTNDKDEIKKEIVEFLNKEYKYVICVNDVITMIEDLRKYKNKYGYIYKDSMNCIDESYDFFKESNDKYIIIPNMFYSGVGNRYLKFDNQNSIIKNIRNILYGDITGFNIIKEDNNKYYIISPFVRENALDILENKKNKIDKLLTQNYNEIREFYVNNLKNNIQMELEISNQEKFLKEYPIERIKEFTLEEYCLGLEDYKQSFCYKLEFGEYKKTGFGIGGGTAAKFGIYFSGEDYKYHGKNNCLIEDEDVNKYFEEYKKQLVDFLNYLDKNEPNFNIEERYPLLGGSGGHMFLTKLLCLYYPNRFMAMSKLEKYKKFCEYFNCKYEKNAIKNSYYCNSIFRKNICESQENHGFYIANCVWKFFNDNEEKKGEDEEKSMKELFKQWMLEKGLAITTINGYINSIKLTSRDAIDDNLINREIFEVESAEELDEFIELILSHDKFIRRSENNHGNNIAALNNYRSFLFESAKKMEIQDDKYDKNDFLNEVFIEEDKYESIVSILNKKKNIILEGAPGVGKTFMAKRLAYSIIGTKDTSKVEIIQFHQSYSYEDFIEGYRPNENGFELQRGIFYKLCKRAYNDRNNNYYLIIDEINRGNLSKIFGELLMLIENDKREDSLKLAYSEEEFSVPENLYIIGLMNTADRSLALIDYALRRRFSFIRIEPAFESEKFIKAFNDKFDNNFSDVIEIIKKINEAIEQDKSLGAGFKIGHSYFCPNLKDRKGNKKDIEDIIMYEIMPLLEEYWYDEPDSIVQWKDALSGVIND